jgi:class 3 adenylate cyclase
MEDFRAELRERLSASQPVATMKLSESTIKKRAADLDHPMYRDLELGRWVDQYSAVLFLDIRGFTRLSMALPVDETARILNAVISVAADRLRAYGAHINDFPGDGIMAVFTEEEHGEQTEIHARALYGASNLMTLLSATLRDELLRVGIEDPVQVAIGLYSGRVRWQRVGSEECNRLMAIGEVAPLAAKFATSEHTKAWETMIGGPIAEDVPDDLKERQPDFVRTYAHQELSRTKWLLDTSGMAQTIPDLQVARSVTTSAHARRSAKLPSASSLVTLQPATRRHGSGKNADHGVG